MVADPIEARRRAAELSGTASTTPSELSRWGVDLTDGRGYDIAVEAVGSLDALNTGVEVVRSRGTVVSVGVPTSPTWELGVQEAFRRELALRFAVGDPIRERDRVLTMLATKHLDVSATIGAEVLLTDAVEWFHSFARGEAMKVLVHTSNSGG